MPGPAPKQPSQRRRQNKPARGEWTAAPGIGWQHGPMPDPPHGLLKVSRDAWATWMRAWFAAHWTPGDVPGLRHLIRLYDATERGQTRYAGELRIWCDTYGISPKGQQDRRWTPPKAEGEPTPAVPESAAYAHLRLLGVGGIPRR